MSGSGVVVKRADLDAASGGYFANEQHTSWLADCPCCGGATLSLPIDESGPATCEAGCDASSIAKAICAPREAGVPGAGALGGRHRGTRAKAPATAGDSRVPAPGAPGTLVKLDVERLLATEPEPVDWLIGGVVSRGALTLLSGREKQGKSLLLLALAARSASGGGDVAGIEVKATRVVVVDAENGEREVQRRLHLLGLKGRGNLSVYETRGHDLRRNLVELEKVLLDEKPGLVVLDSWRSLWGGDENDAGEVARCLDPLRALIRAHDCGAALIHHLSRAGAYRGSTAIGASVENLVELSRHEDDADRRRRKLSNSACRFDQEADDRWLRLEQDLEHKRLHVERAEPFRPRSGARETTKDQLLANLDGVMTWADWARAAGHSPKNGTARRARGELAAEALVRETPGGWAQSTVAPGQQKLELS